MHSVAQYFPHRETQRGKILSSGEVFHLQCFHPTRRRRLKKSWRNVIRLSKWIGLALQQAYILTAALLSTYCAGTMFGPLYKLLYLILTTTLKGRYIYRCFTNGPLCISYSPLLFNKVYSVIIILCRLILKKFQTKKKDSKVEMKPRG